jgi:hypothetical protein
MLCTDIVSDIQNNFLHVLQKEELLTKIYLYIMDFSIFSKLSMCRNPEGYKNDSFNSMKSLAQRSKK